MIDENYIQYTVDPSKILKYQINNAYYYNILNEIF